MNLGFEEYITHLKFETDVKNDCIEFGKEDEHEIKSLNELNYGNNIIVNLKGFVTNNGIRALGCDYMNCNDFLLTRLVDVFRLRHLVLHNKEYKEKYDNPKEISKLNIGMKCFLKVCKLPKNTFWGIVKYL